MIYSSKTLILFCILASSNFNEFNFKLTNNSVMVNGLKLTPVQQLTQRIDLSSESHSIAVALNRAIGRKELTVDYEDMQHSSSPSLHHFYNDLMDSVEFQSLKMSMKRWGAIEDKLRLSMLSENPAQMQIFEDIVHNVASGKVLFARTLLLSEESTDLEVINYLETSCPVLWKYASSWRSTDTDGWLDCFSSLNILYTKIMAEPNLAELEAKLSHSLPWLRLVVTGITTSTSDKPYLESLSALHRKDRQNLSLELKNSWTLIESIRGSFKILVDDFMNSNSARIRLGTFIKAQQVTDEILEQFAKSTTVTERDSAAYLAESSRINLTSLRSKLHNEIKRETWIYLFVMNGVVESGESFVADLRQKLVSGARQQDLLSSATELMVTGRIDFSEGERDTTTVGFIGIDEVLHIFESALESVQLKDAVLLSSHHADTVSAQSSADAVNADRTSSASSSRTSKKSSGSSARRASKRSQQQAKEKPASSKHNHKPSTTGNPKKIPSRWSSLIKYLGYASSSAAALGFFAALCGYYIKLSRQSVKSGRSSFRCAASLLHLKLVTSTSPSGVETGNEFDSSFGGIIGIVLENMQIFIQELRLRISTALMLMGKLLSTCMHFMQKNRPIISEKSAISKELSVECNSKAVAVVSPFHFPPSPTTVATTSPGSPQRKPLPFASLVPVEALGSSIAIVKKPAKVVGKKKQFSSAAEKSVCCDLPAEETLTPTDKSIDDFEMDIKPFIAFSTVDIEISTTVEAISQKVEDSPACTAASAKSKSRKSQSGKKKVLIFKAVEELSMGAPTVTNNSVEEAVSSEGGTETDQGNCPESDVKVEEIAKDLVVSTNSEKLPSEYSSQCSLLEEDVFFEEWKDLSEEDDGEWISASSAQSRSSKQTPGNGDSSRASVLCRQQLIRKAAEAAYSTTSSRLRPVPSKSGREKERSPRVSALPAKVPSTSRVLSHSGKELESSSSSSSAAASMATAAIPPSPQRAIVGKLDYSAVLAKNIPPSVLAATAAVPTATKANKQAEAVNATNPPTRKGPKARNNHSAPPSHGPNYSHGPHQQGYFRPPWTRTESRSIASNSTATTNADDGEHGTLSDSDTSPVSAFAEDGLQQVMYYQYPLPVYPAQMIPAYLPDDPTHMVPMYPQVPPYVLHPMQWSCSPDVLQQQQQPLYYSTASSPGPVMGNMPGDSPSNSPVMQLDDFPTPQFTYYDVMVYSARMQIEYYFSDLNLAKDTYLLSLMDSEGFVELNRIVPFNRIKNLGATSQHILEAVLVSPFLEVKDSDEVRNARNDIASIAELSDTTIFETKIRRAPNTFSWVYHQPVVMNSLVQ